MPTGVDGCRGGWVWVRWEPARLTAGFVKSIEELLNLSPPDEVFAVDIPIGLESTQKREADLRARQRLSAAGRASSVFPAPLRAVLDCETYPEANERSRAVGGFGLSKQTWNLIPKIREVDELLAARPELDVRVYEAHPEFSFLHLHEECVRTAKHGHSGGRVRSAALQRALGDPFVQMLDAFGHPLVKADDLLDATVLSLTAQRLAAGIADFLPPDQPRDGAGRRMAIAF